MCQAMGSVGCMCIIATDTLRAFAASRRQVKGLSGSPYMALVSNRPTRRSMILSLAFLCPQATNEVWKTPCARSLLLVCCLSWADASHGFAGQRERLRIQGGRWFCVHLIFIIVDHGRECAFLHFQTAIARLVFTP